jgi:hypothetical protein
MQLIFFIVNFFNSILNATTSNLIKFLLNLSYKLDCIFVIFSSSKIKLSLEKSKFILLEVKKKKVLEKI